MSLYASSRSHYLAVVTLLDQLDPKEFNWQLLSVILEGQSAFPPNTLFAVFDEMKSNIEFSQIVYNFLINQERAGSCWVNFQTYANLARHVLEFLDDK